MLYIAANNPGHFTVGDLVTVLAAVVAFTALVYGAAALVFRGRAAGMLPALVTFLGLIWIFGAPLVEGWLVSTRLPLPPMLVVAFGGLATAALIYGLARRPRPLRTAATFLTLTYGLLALYLCVDIARDWRSARQQLSESRLLADLARPIPARSAGRTPARDVYVIVLDEYANAAVLQEVLGFDNGWFEDSLRALGFHIPRSVASNYARTSLSLPSLLNAAQVDRVDRELPRGTRDPTLLNHLVATNRVARFMRSHGYRFILFPSSWWNSTRASPLADSIVQVWPGLSLGRELSLTEFRRAIRQSTIFGQFYKDVPGDAEIVRGTLQGVSRLPSTHEPVFAFAHVISPHPPYVFDRSCRSRVPGWRLEPAGYLGQLECVNHLVLAMVTRLLRDSDIPPVIVLQGDHGTPFRDYSNAASLDRISPGAAWERLGAFGAYYLPDGGAQAFGDSVTVVNVLGNILRWYFGADLAPESDEQYVSLDPSPFELRRVDPLEGRR